MTEKGPRVIKNADDSWIAWDTEIGGKEKALELLTSLLPGRHTVTEIAHRVIDNVIYLPFVFFNFGRPIDLSTDYKKVQWDAFEWGLI